MDEELKNLIAEYLKQIEKKEGGLTLLKSKIDTILGEARVEFQNIQSDLENKFNENSIQEEEYLQMIKKNKEDITQRIKKALDSVVDSIEELNIQIEEKAKVTEDKIAALRNELAS